MKPSLERTAVLSKDLTEQAECKYVIMIPDANITLAADSFTATDKQIDLFVSDTLIASFSAQLTWLAIDRTCVEVIKREDQLKRHAENVREEEALMMRLMPEEMKKAKKTLEEGNGEKMPWMDSGKSTYGQYL